MKQTFVFLSFLFYVAVLSGQPAFETEINRNYFVTHDKADLIQKLTDLPCGIKLDDPIKVMLDKLEEYLYSFQPSSAYPDDVYALEANMQALKSVKQGGYGIGSVLIDENGKIIAAAHNSQIQQHRSDLHAEMTLLTNFEESHKSKKYLNVYVYRPGLAVFSSAEPCPMCFIRINTTGADTRYCTPGPDDGMVSRTDFLPPAWKEMALKRKVSLVRLNLPEGLLGMFAMNIIILV
jgi:cytosine deaminase